MRLLLILALIALPQAAIADTWERTYAVKDRAALRVDGDDCNLIVTGWKRNEISVQVRTSGLEIGAKGLLIEDQQTGDGVSIRLREPRGPRFRIRWEPTIVEIRVPEKAHLDLRTGDGRIEVEGVTGSLSAESGDGAIIVRSLDGQMNLRTGDGRIIGEGLRGDLSARTGDGRVIVDGVFAALEVTSGDGRIEAHALPGSKVTSPWSIRTNDGSVRLFLPEDMPAALDARTDDGRVSLNAGQMVIGEIERRSVRTRIGGGGGDVRVRSGDGNISITVGEGR